MGPPAGASMSRRGGPIEVRGRRARAVCSYARAGIWHDDPPARGIRGRGETPAWESTRQGQGLDNIRRGVFGPQNLRPARWCPLVLAGHTTIYSRQGGV